MKRIIAVDFDGVIHHYDKWKPGMDYVYSKPVKGAKDALEQLAEKFEVVIITSRKDLKGIRKWLKKNNFPNYKVTYKKIPAAVYIDDRAIRFTNWPDILRYFI